MGGIAGIVYPDVFQVSQQLLPMLDTLAFRGPSIKDEHSFRHIQVGVCGSKLNSNKATIVAGLDGTLYNSKVLIAELKSAGCRFIDETDAEILTHAYEYWGPSFSKYLQGDFALFVLDQRNERLILARDRIGKKPLYWYNGHGYFIFASELKAMLSTGAVPQTAAIDSLSAYLYFGYTPQDMSPIKDVNKLLPGYYLQFNRNRSTVIESYWSYSKYFQEKTSDNRDTIEHKVDEMLQESVKQRLPEKGPFGCVISGGLGSASIAYYLHKLAPADPFRAFTVEFQGENTQDKLAAQEVANTLQLTHECGLITPQNFLDDFVKIVWHLDEPLADPNVIATWRLATMAQPVKTVFSGMGSDELLAGHNRYTLAERRSSFVDQAIQSCMPLLKQLLLPILTKIHQQSAYRILQFSRTNPWHLDYLHQNALFSNEMRSAASPMLGKLFDPMVFLHKFHNLSKIPSTVASFLYFDVKTRLADCYILQYERLISANGLDWRTPFLAETLIEYLAKLPEPDEMPEGDAFFVLKDILKDTFSPSLINRPKKTRKHFLALWATTPELSELFRLLLKGTLVESGLISKEWLGKQLSSPQQQQESFRYLWGLLALEIWFHLYINRPIEASPPTMSVRELLTEK